jgi:protein SCO1/2
LVSGALALAAVEAARTRATAAARKSPLAILGQVPTFHLVDQKGDPFSTDSMVGHVSVVDFFFTRCRSSCPRLTAHMAELQQQLTREHSPARLVSFTVDPENDTPQVLSTYAERAQADTPRWAFVTGPPDDIARAVVLGFKVSAAKMAQDAGDYDVVHGNWFVLVDARARLRGYYPMDEQSSLETLLADIRSLERE